MKKWQPFSVCIRSIIDQMLFSGNAFTAGWNPLGNLNRACG
jgi:hypothetical protein